MNGNENLTVTVDAFRDILHSPKHVFQLIQATLYVLDLHYYNPESPKAIYNSLRVDINPDGKDSYYQNIRRIIDAISYHKLNDFGESTITTHPDSIVLKEKRNFDILVDSGNPEELSHKTALWLQLMYPERDYRIGQIPTNQSGATHTFAVEVTDDGLFIIDPSYDVFGTLEEVNNRYPKKEIPPNVSPEIASLLSVDYSNPMLSRIGEVETDRYNYYRVAKDGSTRIKLVPFLGAKHTENPEDLFPMGICLIIHSGSSIPLIGRISNAGKTNFAPLSPKISAFDLKIFLDSTNARVSLDVCKLIIQEYSKIVSNGGIKNSGELYFKD